MRLTFSVLTWLAVVLAILQLHGRNHAAPAPDTKTETPVEKCRRLLEQSVSVELEQASLAQAIEHFGTLTKLRIRLDEAGLEVDPNDGVITCKDKDIKAKTALRSILRPIGMTYVILDDTVLVTSESVAAYRQMKQTVSLQLEEIPLANALNHVARQTGANLVLDPRLSKEQRGAAITLQLDEVPLETAVKLLAEIGNLGSARVGNVLFITTQERAERLRADPDNQIGIAMVPAPPRGGAWPPPGAAPNFAPQPFNPPPAN